MTAAPLLRPDRSAAMDDFLARLGWAGATRMMLAGDASFRRYERVHFNGRIAVLMDAPPPWEDVRPFIRVTHQLAAFGLSVPTILAADEEQGFLLLEDLGDDSFTRVLNVAPEREAAMYQAATEALIQLNVKSNAAPLKSTLSVYDEAVYLREVGLFAEWFLPQIVGMERAPALRQEFLALWRGILGATPLLQTTLVHRDYHADNLFWLEQRSGLGAVGMIDYQDALLGDPVYDLASLLEDARRDVGKHTRAACLQQFMHALGEDHDIVAARYAVLAAQRNAKIIGIFTRLTVRDGKPHYIDYLPRVWGHFMYDLKHPLLQPIYEFVNAHVPETYRGRFVADYTVGGIIP